MAKRSSINHKRAALFLDRDGVIIHDAGYTRDPNQVQLISGIEILWKWATSQNFWIFIVTNQGGIAKGLISWSDYEAVTHRMFELLDAKGLKLPHHVCFSPYFQEVTSNPHREWFQLSNPWGIPHEGRWHPSWRKPQPGMVHYLAHKYSVDLTESVIVGDQLTDQLLVPHGPLKKGYWLLPQGKQINSEFPLILKDRISPVTSFEEVVSHENRSRSHEF